MEQIPFSRPTFLGCEAKCVADAASRGQLSAGPAAFACEQLLASSCRVEGALLTPSASSALEMAFLLLELQPGDEVIMPSFQFPSAANAIMRCGAIPVFVDIDPLTMNIDPAAVEAAINSHTRAIAVMHYAGIACDLPPLLALAKRHDLALIEDAAQAVGAAFNGQALGSFGRAACFSFHATKNLTMGEGGALLLTQAGDISVAEQLRDKGTNQAAFRRGEQPFYCWQRTGVSAVASELAAAYLLPQLEQERQITAARLALWRMYDEALSPLYAAGRLRGPYLPPGAQHNGHIYFIKTADAEERTSLQNYLAAQGIGSASHYRPLHSSPAGLRFCRFHGQDRYTTKESERLLRLPLYHGLLPDDVERVAQAVAGFYFKRGAIHAGY